MFLVSICNEHFFARGLHIDLKAPLTHGWLCAVKLTELAADYQDEHATATQTTELLEMETAERIQLDKEVKDLQVWFQQFRGCSLDVV